MKKTLIAKKQVKTPENDVKREENQKKMIGRIIYDRKKEDGVNLIEQYFELQEEFEKKFGPNTIIMMQVGDFFEFYGVDNKEMKIGDMNRLSEITNLTLSRRNKNILENSRENAQMCGFPQASLKKYLNILLQHNYTVVLIEQTADHANTTREITAIHSPGTYIDEVQNADPNNIMSIYIEDDICYKTGQATYLVGLSSIDLSTGECTVYQKTKVEYDKCAIFEDMYRFMESYNPKEIILHHGLLRSISVEDVMNHLNTWNRICHVQKEEKIPSKYEQKAYQEGFFGKIYPDHGQWNVIEYLGFEFIPQALLSFLFLLEFSYEHNENILKKIQKPELWKYNEHLILYHNTMYQLNIIPTASTESSFYSSSGKSRYRSLYDVILKTCTSMGKRLLKTRLMNPITSVEELEKRYHLIEHMIEADYVEIIKHGLKDMMDIERMHRKMELGMIHPHEFGTLHESYEKVDSILRYLVENGYMEKYDIQMEVYQKFEEYRREYSEMFDLNEMKKHNLQSITMNFFRAGQNEELDQIQRTMNEIQEYFERETNLLSNKIEAGSDFVKWDVNDRDGYFMVCTKKRSEILEKKWTAEERKRYEIKKLQATTVKITGPEWDQRSNQFISLRERIKVIAREYFLQVIQNMIMKYDETLKQIQYYIAHLDVVQSSVTCAIQYGYHRPQIVDRYEGMSYFEAKSMRHPLIELIHDKVTYIDNDIELLKGDEACNGILLMGLNGVGKSSMAKAVGCNIVMAQMGMYVPCSEFRYYPYEKIFTRINGDDNIFKGMSSFVVEMSELRSIIKYADDRSIVLGDEVCKGTEETSALSIVSATIQKFSERRVNFIMATHFHKLYEMEEVREIKNIRFKHLSVYVDEENQRIEYGRKLIDGPGDTLYGLEIAQFLIDDVSFIKNARKTRNRLTYQHDEILVEKKSNYNAKLYVDECVICGRNANQIQLHTHHIVEQNEYENGKMNVNGVQMNQMRNLVVLCEDHHEEIHHGKLRVIGWKDTSQGRVLEWYYEKEEEKETEEKVEEEVVIMDESMEFLEEFDWLDREIDKMKKERIDLKIMMKQLMEMAKKKGEKWTKKKLEEKVKQHGI